VTPKECSLRLAVGEHELCPGNSCVYWEAGSANEPECVVDRLGIPANCHREDARVLLDLRLRVDEARTELERADAPRRLSELLNLNRD
jgi:hypothetical protein